MNMSSSAESKQSIALQSRERELVACTMCPKMVQRNYLQQHIARHNKTGDYKCPVCERKFLHKAACDRHINTHSQLRPFKCEICSTSYKYSCHLKHHIDVAHKGEKLYRCDFCPRVFTQRTNLEGHMTTHRGIRPFVCLLCGHSVTSKVNLNRHLYNHGVQKGSHTYDASWLKVDIPKAEQLSQTGADEYWSATGSSHPGRNGFELGSDDPALRKSDRYGPSDDEDVNMLSVRNFQCQLCPSDFPNIYALRNHRKRAHGLVTAHVCPACGNYFFSAVQLKNHIRQSHPLRCPICSESMAERRQWMLEAHVKAEHPDVPIAEILKNETISLTRSVIPRTSPDPNSDEQKTVYIKILRTEQETDADPDKI